MPQQALALRRAISLFVTLLLTLSLFPATLAQSPAPPAKAASAASPKLVVVIVVDQFRYDYLERFGPRFGSGGFRRLLREGASFTACNYPYAGTETAPGHASIATGATPDRHGIAGNSWYDRARDKDVEAVDDDNYPPVGAAPGAQGLSPRNMLGTSLADELRLATGGASRVFGAALKDRAAMFSTGQSANGAYWFDRDTGNFVTSKFYADALPAWVTQFNARRPADRYLGKDWVVAGKVSTSMTMPDGKPNRDFYTRIRYTPYGNELPLEFARVMVENEKIGAGPATDFLFLGFSSNDYVGHQFGPYSNEVAEVSLRTDAMIAGFLSFLDQRVGRANYWLMLSADHGVAPTLAQARALRHSGKDVRTDKIDAAVNEALTKRWGQANWLHKTRALYFNRATLERLNVSLADAARVAGDAALTVDGVNAYYSPWASRGAVASIAAMRLSYFPGRGPDLEILQEPFALFDDRGGTTHGTPYSYDTHVPCILVGAPFRPGAYATPASPTDLSPTMASVLGINPPAVATGRVLTEALREQLAAQPAGRQR